MARPAGKTDVAPTSIRFPKPVDVVWTATAKKLNIPKTSVLFLALQEFAAKHGIEVAEPIEEKEGVPA